MKRLLLVSVPLLVLSACNTKKKIGIVQADSDQLSQPVIKVAAYFFEEETEINVNKAQSPAAVRYETGGTSPTPESPVADGPIKIKESTTLRFQSMGGDFLPSREVTIEVLKLRPERVMLSAASLASPPYANVPQAALTDRQKASKDFRNANWLGYQKKPVAFLLSFPEVRVNGVTLSVLEDQGSWIFAPSTLKAAFYNTAGLEVGMATKRYLPEVQKSGSHYRFLTVITPQLRAASIKLEVENLSAIPGWHQGAGSPPWVFVDEVLLR